jgi:transcriptional regulator with XRE-family HTH domain
MIAKAVEERLDTLDNHITWAHIAKELKLTPSALSHFRNNGTELNFASLLTLSKLLFKNRYADILCDWCVELKKPSNIRAALEFLTLNRKTNHLEKLLHNINDPNNPSKILIELFKTYTYHLKHQQDVHDTKKLLCDIEEEKIKTKETYIPLLFAKFYFYHNENNHQQMKKIYSEVKHEIGNLKDSLLKSFFEIRLYELESILSLFFNGDTVTSRIASEKILRNKLISCAAFIGDVYYRMGMSYLFESPDMCLVYLNKSEKIFRCEGLLRRAKSIRENEIVFAEIYWGRAVYENLTNDSYRVFYLVSEGREEEAKGVLNILDRDSPFTRLYSGMAHKDADMLLESLLLFKKTKNMFYAKLPLDQLKQYEEKSEIVKLILN